MLCPGESMSTLCGRPQETLQAARSGRRFLLACLALAPGCGKMTFPFLSHGLGFLLSCSLCCFSGNELALLFLSIWLRRQGEYNMAVQCSNGWTTWWDVEILGSVILGGWGDLLCTPCTSQKEDCSFNVGEGYSLSALLKLGFMLKGGSPCSPSLTGCV